jgi:hypothetical protein
MDAIEKRIAACVEEFDGQGWHRTGTDVDVASGEWLAAEARRLGIETELEAYAFERVDVREAFLEVDGRRIEGLPLFDGSFTGPEGISGNLGPAGSAAEIGFAVAGGEADAGSLDELRRSGRHQALVLATLGRSPGLMAHNASDFGGPFGPPALQVSGEERAWLEGRLASSSSAKVVAWAEKVPSRSSNVVGRWPGSGARLAPVVVTTPRSGWWQCASERGGGIAAWLEVARSVVEARPARPVWFVAFSGHELGHLGSDHFLERRPEIVGQVLAWVHFGANVGGAAEPSVRVSASNEDLISLAKACLTSQGVTGVLQAPAGRVLGLESGDIARRGGICVSLLGGNAYFHIESDRWPQAVDAGSVARQAAAFAELVLGLAVEG